MADTTADVCLEMYSLTETSFCNYILYFTFINPILYLFLAKIIDYLQSKLCHKNNYLGCK